MGADISIVHLLSRENCYFYRYCTLTYILSISSFRTKLCIGLGLQKLCQTPGISIHLCAWGRVYLWRKHYREPLTNKRWETKGRTKRRKSVTGAMMERKTQYCVHLEEVSERGRERQSHGREAGSSAEREREREREGGLRIKRGSLNEIIWKKSKTMREAFRETDKRKSGRLSTNWAGGEKKTSSLVSAVNSAQTDLQFCFQREHKDFRSPLMHEHTLINIIIFPAYEHEVFKMAEGPYFEMDLKKRKRRSPAIRVE